MTSHSERVSDRITLTVPRERPFYGIAHLVLGGLAVRRDLTFEHLEDMQVALGELLEYPASEDNVTVTMQLVDGTVEAAVGPFDGEALRAELDREGEDIGLRRVLETVVDGVDLMQRDGGHWVEFTKNVGKAD